MKTLTLRIENHSTLENGGPVLLRLEGRGAQVGRKAGNDWVLPDSSRHISGHHFDISFENGEFVLSDVSSNGTFLHGDRYRLDGAYVIQDGNRFTVGHYIIRAQIEETHSSEAEAPAPSAPVDEFDDVWGSLGERPAEQTPPPAGLQAPPGLPPAPPGSAFTQRPDYVAPQPTGTGGIAAPPAAPSFQGDNQGLAGPPSFTPPPAPPPPPPQQQVVPYQSPAPQAEQFAASPPVSQPPAPAEETDTGSAMMQGFIEGAGISASDQIGINPHDLGLILGRIARTGTQELMHMLQDRAAVKLFVSNEDRTMREASGNNPMKFMQDATQAFDTLFVTPRDGYQTGADGFENALGDVRRHQSAVIAALQPALADMLSGLSPEEVEEAIGGGLLGGGGRKAWEEFCKRWEQRASEGENGMLDAFIKSFSKHYSEALRKL